MLLLDPYHFDLFEAQYPKALCARQVQDSIFPEECPDLKCLNKFDTLKLSTGSVLIFGFFKTKCLTENFGFLNPKFLDF